MFNFFNLFNLSNKKKFKQHLQEALSDGKLDQKDAKFLEAKTQELGISQAYADKLRLKDYADRTAYIRNNAITEKRLSPEHEKILYDTAQKLDLEPMLSEEFKIYKNLWQYENNGTLTLDEVESPLLLGKGEVCYFSAPSEWRQIKTVTKRGGSIGAAIGVPITKGVRFYLGKSFPAPVKEYEEMRSVSFGDIYITNKKIFFNGDTKTSNITMGRIAQLQLFSDGLEVRKTSGRPDMFVMDSVSAEYIAAIIHSLLNE